MARRLNWEKAARDRAARLRHNRPPSHQDLLHLVCYPCKAHHLLKPQEVITDKPHHCGRPFYVVRLAKSLKKLKGFRVVTGYGSHQKKENKSSEARGAKDPLRARDGGTSRVAV